MANKPEYTMMKFKDCLKDQWDFLWEFFFYLD